MTGGQMDEFTYEIGVENAGERIDKFLSGELSELSRSYIQKLLKEGMVTLGGKARRQLPLRKRMRSRQNPAGHGTGYPAGKYSPRYPL